MYVCIYFLNLEVITGVYCMCTYLHIPWAVVHVFVYVSLDIGWCGGVSMP